MPPRLVMSDIDKSFAGVTVLSRVDLVVEPGEVVALLGANGAGKSTLMKILAGLYARDAGGIRIDGAEVDLTTPARSVAAGVRMLPQEVSVMPDMTVAENIYLGDLPLRRGFPPGIDDAAMRARSRTLLTELGFPAIDPAAPVRRLPVAEQRIVEIARALAGDARLLVMDEPTAALTEQEARAIFRLIRRLQERGVSVIYISHYLAEVFEISDRIVVLRDGRNAGLFPTREATRADVLVAMLGGDVGDMYAPAAAAAPGVEVLQVSGLSLPGSLGDIAFSLRAGEILGVFGLVGSGIEVLGRAVYGALGPAAGGRVRLGGREYRPRSAQHGKRAGIGFVAAERKKEGIFAALSLRENITLPFEERFQRGPFVSRAAESAHAAQTIRALGIRARGPEQSLRTLSGGNQQKVCLGRWLVEGVRLLILEEPTRGVDVGARREIYARLRDLAARGLAMLVLSSDVEEVAGLCDRALVLDRGRIVGEFAHGAPAAALMAATANDPGFRAA
ncbi:MAG TPA: sugar ABC transporter ATP-binding protein [Acetobacteraceae bacterium]|nr:sugar ABC transporter ATP-binding protein [Acetobacteraceae bacterium]